MRHGARFWMVLVGLWIAGAFAWPQAPVPAPQPAPLPQTVPAEPPASSAAPAAAGGKLHGAVKSGNVPLPGVAISAQNTLTGKRFTTTTDITGAWSMTIPQNGRYVIRTQFAAFAQGSQEALLNAANRDQTVNFDLVLASRAAEQDQKGQSAQMQQAIRQLTGNGLQSLSLMNALAGGGTEAGTAGAQVASGASLPSVAGNSDFSGDSVSITGQSGSVSPLAGVDMDRLRDLAESLRAQNGGQGPGGPGGAPGQAVGILGGGGGPFAGGGFGGGFGDGGFGGGGFG